MIALGISAWLAVEYRDTPILGFHAFRQTQTALTSYWVCRGGFHVAYWTPVVGYPWAIPFEFPIYQWIVAGIACPLGINLDPVGRITSYAFWVACLWPASIVCRRLFADCAGLYFWTFAALFLSAPLYLFWGRSFLMETAALFFALTYLAYSLEMASGADRWRDAVLTCIFMTLAILQKSTSVLPLSLFGLVYLYRARSELKLLWRSSMVQKGLLAYGLSLLIGITWVKYSDHVKTSNPVGTMLTSGGTGLWNFGTLHARFSEALWEGVIWGRVARENIGSYLGVIAIALALIMCRVRRTVIAASIGLYILYFMVFENLLFVHDYYPVSNTVYLIFALSVSIAALAERARKGAIVAALLLLGVVAVELTGYFAGPRFAMERQIYAADNPVLEVAGFVREHTADTDPIIVYGDDWNSQIPYYGQRRAFVVPKWFPEYLAPLDAPERYLDRGPGAILVCGAARQDVNVLKKMADDYPTWPKGALEMCDIYLRSGPNTGR